MSHYFTVLQRSIALSICFVTLQSSYHCDATTNNDYRLKKEVEVSPMNDKKTVLVAGGAGFLGTTLCTTLHKRGYRIIIVDNFYTGRNKNITELLKQPDVELITHDITLPLDVKADIIFNLACPASPPHYQKDPIFTTKTSVIGTLNLLELARKNNARFIQASTSEVYGDPVEHPQTERYRGSVNPIGIRACYDEGKRCAESLCFDFHRMYNVDIKVMRIFNTYGPHMDPADGRVVSNFIMQALAHEPITIYGSGKQTRSFCYVDDLIEGMIALMLSPAGVTGPINLGNPDEYTLLQLAGLISTLTGSPSELVFKPLPSDDPCRRMPDISQAEKVLNWQPSTSLERGLAKTIAYFADEMRQAALTTTTASDLTQPTV